MEPAMALAIMRAIAFGDSPDALPTLARLARVLASLEGRIEPEEWETIAIAGATIWSAAMGDYDAHQVASDFLQRMRRP